MRYCKICCEALQGNEPFLMWLFEKGMFCSTCLQNMVILDKTIRIKGKCVHVLYEYNDFMKQLWQQYQAGDVALTEVFLYPFQNVFHEKYAKQQIVCIGKAEQTLLMRKLLQTIKIEAIVEDEDACYAQKACTLDQNTILFLIHDASVEMLIQKTEKLSVKKIICLFQEREQKMMHLRKAHDV